MREVPLSVSSSLDHLYNVLIVHVIKPIKLNRRGLHHIRQAAENGMLHAALLSRLHDVAPSVDFVCCIKARRGYSCRDTRGIAKAS